jgi:hypothetical protein
MQVPDFAALHPGYACAGSSICRSRISRDPTAQSNDMIGAKCPDSKQDGAGNLFVATGGAFTLF